MLNQHRAGRSAPVAAVQVLWMAMCCGVLAGAAVAQVQVTSVQGAATADGRPLSLHGEVAENALLEVAKGGRCSLLLADVAVVQLCGSAAASFHGVGNDRPGTIDLDAGELKANTFGRDPLKVRTPAGSIELRRAGALISVSPSGDTVVDALDGQVRVALRNGARVVVVSAGQQLTFRQGGDLEAPRTLSREKLAKRSDCLAVRADYVAALSAERAILRAGAPAVSAGPGMAGEVAASDLQQIASADFPGEGLPLDDSSTPSALVKELSKRSMNEEICDPVSCNPVYGLDPPGACGVPPQRGCIP